MIAAACALGLLTGLLVGLSTSGVTASVVSAVLAMAAGVAALTGIANPFLPSGEKAAQRSAGHNWAVFGFALLTVAGLGGGLWARTHSALSPSPQEIAERWQAAGLSPQTASRLAVLQITGADLSETGAVKAGAAEPVQAMASVLFSDTSPATCQRTDPSRAPDAGEARNTWSLAPAPWPALAKHLEAMPKATLQAVWAGLCEEAR